MPAWLTLRVALYGVAGAVLLGALWWAFDTVTDWRVEAAKVPGLVLERDTAKASLKAANEANAKAVERQQKDDARMAALATGLDSLRTETSRLAAAVRQVRLVSTPEPTHDNPNPAARLSAGFGVCFSALAAGDPADAAACQAAGGGVRDPVRP